MTRFRLIASRFIFIFFVIGLMPNVWRQAAEAAPTCRVIFSRETSAVRLTEVSGRENLNVRGAKLQAVKNLFLEYGIDIQTKNLAEALEGASEVLRNGDKKPSKQRSDQMAELGDQLLKLVKTTFDQNQNLMLSYFVAEAVLKLERIQIQTYDVSARPPEIFKDSGVLHIDQFHKYVESYIDKTDLYEDKTSRAGIITMSAIRHLYSNNSWIIGLKDHDMFHLHYSYGHPFYLAINFMASRSINDKRYSMISSLWESIDDTQYNYETEIASYFKSRRMSPQEGMIYLARATDAILDQVENALNDSYDDGYMNQVSYEKNKWKPVLHAYGRTAKPKSAVVYDDELTDFINKSLQLKQDPKNKKYYNYYRRKKGETARSDHDVSIF